MTAGRPGRRLFLIDTPPPSVVGRTPQLTHVVAYVQMDVLARYAAMNGREVRFPVGWDDNVDAAPRPGAEDQADFEELWRGLGISVDWRHCYRTSGEDAARVAQAAFLHDLARGRVRPGPVVGLVDPVCGDFWPFEDAPEQRVRPCGHELVPAEREAWLLRSPDDVAVLTEHAEQLTWHPAHMEARFLDLVRTRRHSSAMSERRSVGIPVPVWLPLDETGRPDRARPILPDPTRLPIDPASQTPPGRRESERGRPGGYAADEHRLTGTATASVTTGIVEATSPLAPTPEDDVVHVRPQGGYIMQSWLVDSLLRHDAASRPWTDVLISGWLRPGAPGTEAARMWSDGPAALTRRHGGDGVRMWAASRPPGRDFLPSESAMVGGRRLASTLLTLAELGDADAGVSEVDELLDLSMLAAVRRAVQQMTAALDDFRYDRATRIGATLVRTLDRDFCALTRADAGQEPRRSRSAQHALRAAMRVVLRLMAPFMPSAASEGWVGGRYGSGTIHTAAWPAAHEIPAGPGPDLYETFSTVLAIGRAARVRTARTAYVAGPPGTLELLRPATADLVRGLGVTTIELVAADRLAVTATGP